MQPSDDFFAALKLEPDVTSFGSSRPSEAPLSPERTKLRGIPDPSRFVQNPLDEWDSDMAAPTREEIDAKLALVEAKAETRFLELSSKLDRLLEKSRKSEARIAARASP